MFRLDRGELRRGDEAIHITERERDILSILASARGEHVPREALSGGNAANERTIDVQINRLRRKIEVDPTYPLLLQTVRGIGYRLVLNGEYPSARDAVFLPAASADNARHTQRFAQRAFRAFASDYYCADGAAAISCRLCLYGASLSAGDAAAFSGRDAGYCGHH